MDQHKESITEINIKSNNHHKKTPREEDQPLMEMQESTRKSIQNMTKTKENKREK